LEAPPVVVREVRVVVSGESAEAAELCRTLGGRGFAVTVAKDLAEARQMVGLGGVAIALVDLDRLGPEAIGVLREEAPETEVVVLTSYDTADRAVQAMKEGAADFVVRPLRAEELAVRLRRLVQARDEGDELQRVRTLLGEDANCPGILSDSPSMRTACERLAVAVNAELPVLLTGEPGSGKEFLARAIHARGPGRRRACTILACRVATAEQVDEVLGGLLGRPRGETLLLDGPEALSASAQQIVRKIVAHGEVRVIATSAADLAALVQEGRFDRALWEALRAIEIHLPALRDRGEDVLVLARRFLRVLAARRANEAQTLSPEAAQILLAYPWPGNVGELRRVIAAAHAKASGSEIGAEDLPEAVRRPRRQAPPFTLHLDDRESIALLDLVRQLEEEIRAWALVKAGGEPDRAAAILGEPPDRRGDKGPPA